jgi:type IV pilus assembly protein PilY1
MKLNSRRLFNKTVAVTTLFCMTIQPTFAALLNLASTPLFIVGASVPPLVMLNVPKDHQMFGKLYSDFNDVNDDGVIDTGYIHSIAYYGYFDPFKCYTYAGGRFDPTVNSPTKYCTGQWSGNFLNWAAMSRMDAVRKLLYGGFRTADSNGLTVLERASIVTDGHAWAKHYSGADIDRLVPFSDIDVVARTYVSTSSNSIPAVAAGVTYTALPTRIFTLDNPATGRYLIKGDQVRIQADANNFMFGVVDVATTGVGQNITVRISASTGAAAGPFVAWTITNLSSTGISICNTTNTTANLDSHLNINTGVYPPTTTYPPLIRIARGNYGLWAVSDGKMCQWSGNINGNIGSQTREELIVSGTPPAVAAAIVSTGLSELKANRESPILANVGLTTGGAGPDYIVRVKVCDAAGGLLGTEKCHLYENGNWKPIGLLQQYSSGDSKLIQFGLMTPSYTRNESGGVLRKKMSFLDARPAIGAAGYSPYTPTASDEIDPTTGLFLNANGIIKTMNSLQLFGYGFTASATVAGLYNQGNDNCGTPGLVNPPNDNCSSWGNPVSEMYIETLRYLAGMTPDKRYVSSSPAPDVFSFGGMAKDDLMNLRVQGWSAQVTNQNWCAPLNVIVMNSNVSSYDGNDAAIDIFPAGQDSKYHTNQVGILEGFNAGTTVLAGSNDGPILVPPFISGTDTTGRGLCTPKALSGANGLGDVTGICPEAPVLSGSFLIAGAAKWARENRINSSITKPNGQPIPATDFQALRVNTYGITLSGAAPRIKIAIPGSSPTRYVTILPTGRTISSAGGNPYAGVGAIMDFKVVRQDATSGKFFVSWEDSQQGNDYDLDSWGVISYEFLGGGSQIRVTTDVIYGQAGFSLGFGFVISGVTGGTIDASGAATYGDGAHYLSAHRGGNPGASSGPVFNWPPAVATIGGVALAAGAECSNCQQMDGPRSITFNIAAGSSSSVLLEDPLYYAAKYGNFRDFNQNGVRDAGEWDSKVAGVPDNFFFVTNPAKLEDALEASFISILSRATASSVATNSTSLQTGTTIYQARFNPADWSGQVLAFPVALDGSIAAVPAWDAGDLLKAPPDGPLNFDTGRTIITFDNTPGARVGVPFRLATAPAQLLSNLNTDPVNLAIDGRAQDRLNYIRGDASNEGAAPTRFRPRPVTKLGDIVNSSPNFVGPPNAGFADSAYAAFRQANMNRKPMIYVGGNGGMLHGFSANENGKELLAYVPSKTFPHLNQLTDKAYRHRFYVDGSPEVGDAFFNVGGSNAWRTVLVSTLASGGQGIFALDVTSPTAFSEATAANIVLWEFNDSDDPNLGYSLGQPVIRKMANGKWAAIVSGGYNNSEGTTPTHPAVAGEIPCTDSSSTPTPAGCTTSTTGQAYLYIIFMDGPTGPGKTWVQGTDYIRLTSGIGDVGTPNGLASPLAADVNADGTVDYIYAGDLRGNLVKWDVTSPVTSNWTNTTNRVVLYTAVTPGGAPQPQPITSKIEGTLHPTGTGFIIAFGTGKYLEQLDPSAPYAVQSFYGIWDMNNGSSVSLQTTVGSGRTRLLQQTITTLSSGGNTFRIVTNNQPNWSQDFTPPTASDTGGVSPNNRHLGWYMDFPSSDTTGERSVFRPILTSGRLIFTTLIPTATACEAGGTSFLMIVDPSTGGRIDAAVLDVDANGQLNANDKIDPGSGAVYVSGVQSTIGITPTPTIIRAESTSGAGSGTTPQCQILGTCEQTVAGSGFQLAFALAAGSSGGNASTMIGLGTSGGRVSWRELVSD